MNAPATFDAQSLAALPVHSKRVVIATHSGEYANTAAHKRQLLSTGRGRLLVTWPGEWSTTVFAITSRAERAALLRRL